MIIIFVQKFWSVNSVLDQERHVYVCAKGSVTKFFYAKMFPRKFCSLGQSFMQNHQGIPELFKKNSREGRGCTPLEKNSWRVNKTLDARCAPWVFKHFKFLWMLSAPHLVPDIEYFARINHTIFNWEQKFGNKFPRGCLKKYLNDNEFL